MRYAILLIGLLAASGYAQGSGGRRPIYGSAPERPPELRAKEIVRLSPARVALERARDLSLTTDQFHKLDSLGRAYELSAKDFGKALDTLDGAIDGARRDLAGDREKDARRSYRPRPENHRDSVNQARDDAADQAEADKHLARGTTAKNGREKVLLSVQSTFDASLTTVNGILNEEQKSKLSPIFAGLSSEFTQRLHWQNERSP